MGALLPVLLSLIGRGGVSTASGAVMSKAASSSASKGFSGAAAQAWFASGGAMNGGGSTKKDRQDSGSAGGSEEAGSGFLELLPVLGLVGIAFAGIWKAANGVAQFFSGLKDWSSEIFESQRNLQQFNGSIAASFAQFDAHKRNLAIQNAQANAPGLRSLAASQMDMASSLAPINRKLTDIGNAGSKFGADIVSLVAAAVELSQILEPVAEAAKWYLGHKEKEQNQATVQYLKELAGGKGFDKQWQAANPGVDPPPVAAREVLAKLVGGDPRLWGAFAQGFVAIPRAMMDNVAGPPDPVQPIRPLKPRP